MRNRIYIKKCKKLKFKRKCSGCGKRVDRLATFDGIHIISLRSNSNGFCEECIKKQIDYISHYNYK